MKMVALSSRPTSSPTPKKKDKGPANTVVKKNESTCFFDTKIVAPVDKTRVLSCMSVSEEDTHNWLLFVLNNMFGQMFDSYMDATTITVQ